MKTRLQLFIAEHDLFKKDDHVLVAVSGGRDSVVLAHLLHACGYRIALAHMNFGLRGTESVADERFVRDFGAQLGVKVFLEKANWDMVSGEGVQLQARELRYAFFDRICREMGFDKLATAHHADDDLETTFINLMRGTGIYGFEGIPVQRGNIVRPLLWATRNEIDAYTAEHKLSYRNDASNEGDDYLRNRIRHHLIPLLQEIENPEKLKTSLANLKEDAYAMWQMSAHLSVQSGPHHVLLLKNLPPHARETWLYHCLRPFGFNRVQCRDLLVTGETGKSVKSGAFEAVVFKDEVHILNSDAALPMAVSIGNAGSYTFSEIALRLAFENAEKPFGNARQSYVKLDADKLEFPLILRMANSGDRFRPLGMAHEVGLLRYLKEKGFGPATHHSHPVLCDKKGEICLIVGVQIAEWCKLEPSSVRAVNISITPNAN